jgi:PAS domain S-box-containing protein
MKQNASQQPLQEASQPGFSTDFPGKATTDEPHGYTRTAQAAGDDSFRQVFNGFPDALMVIDSRTMEIIAANPATHWVLGYRQDELIGEPFDVLMPSCRESRRIPAERLAIYGGVFIQEFIHRDGRTVSHDLTATPIVWNRQAAILATLRDIREREGASEKLRRYRRIVNSSSDLMSLIGRDYTLHTVNRAFGEAFGEGSELTGKSLRQVLGTGVFDEHVKHRVDRCLEGEEVRFQSWVDFGDCRRQYMDIALYPHVNAGGDVSGAVAILRDITRTRRLEDRLLRARKMESIATLAGGISHQFNNALFVITGNLELLKHHLDGKEDTLRCVQMIRDSVTRMERLTRHLLAYAEGGKYRPESISLYDFINSTMPLVRHTIGSDIRLSVEATRKLSPVKADVTQMMMMLSIIIENAREALAGRGRITIRAGDVVIHEPVPGGESAGRPGRYVRLSVADDGMGMDSSTLERVFEPFFSTKQPGRGLGLAAAYGIARNHNGWISLESHPLEGTTVNIYLPVADSADAVQACRADGGGQSESVLSLDSLKTIAFKKAASMFCRPGTHHPVELQSARDAAVP